MKSNVATKSIIADLELISEAQLTTADLTPMLDTIFLIILLLLATLMNSSVVRGFPVNLPAFSEETTIQKDDSIEISVDKDGCIYMGKDKINIADIAMSLRAAMARNYSEKILLRADKSVAYGRVAEVLCRVSNCLPDKQVVLVTQEGLPEIVKPNDFLKKVVEK